MSRTETILWNKSGSTFGCIRLIVPSKKYQIDGNAECLVSFKKWDEVLDGTMPNMLLEMSTFIKHHTHLFISVLSQSRGECDGSTGEVSSVCATSSSI